MIYYILEFISRLAANLCFRLRAFGRENFPKKGGFILVSNHVSFLDPVILGVASPRKLNYMARDTLFRNPLFGGLLRSVGCFPLKRGSADRAALKQALKRLGEAKGLVLFPEGRRITRGNESVEPLAGVGFLAVKSKMPIIPAYLKGTSKAMPRGARFILPYKVSVYFGKSFSVDSQMPYEDIARLVMQKIRQLEQNS